jgi:5-methylcytosine-specific restriction endonuclease McrA
VCAIPGIPLQIATALDLAMKNKKPNAARTWKHLDDFVVPKLALNVLDRAVYSYLLRHSHLEGRRRLHFSLPWLASGVRISKGGARTAIRRLLDRRVLRRIERTWDGQVVEVLLPEEIRAALPESCNAADRARSVNIEKLDFFRTDSLRKAIHARERGFCFYCLRRLKRAVQCLDHVVPQARSGGDSYRNLVSCCLECNFRKGQTAPADFLRWLHREGRLTARALTARLRALDALASGKLRPTLAAPANPRPHKGRPPLGVT